MSAVGVFGKLPALGDFLCRGLPPEVSEPFHAWIARGLSHARDRLGARFEPAYMQAPVWRFAVPAGACGPGTAVGVLMPSIDAVGRAFPLALVAPLGGAPRPDVALDTFADWFDALDALARAVLEDGFALEPWLAGVQALSIPAGLSAADNDGWRRVPPEELAGHLAVVGAAGTSVFWSPGSPYVPPGLLVGPGLPEGPAFARLLCEDAVPCRAEAVP